MTPNRRLVLDRHGVQRRNPRAAKPPADASHPPVVRMAVGRWPAARECRPLAARGCLASPTNFADDDCRREHRWRFSRFVKRARRRAVMPED